jgi:probable rRNA maturation factor
MLELDYQIADGVTSVLAPADVEAAVLAALQAHDQRRPVAASVVVRLVDVEESRALNHRYRHNNTPTNVLSFPFDLPDGISLDAAPHLGDLVLCAPVIAAEAAAQQKSPAAHWTHMIVHGVLHLQGYDHHNASTAKEMEDLERRILADLGYPDPYASDNHND